MLDIINSINLYGIYEGFIDTTLINEWNQKYMENIQKNGIFKKSYNQYFKLINDEIAFFTYYNTVVQEYYGTKTKIRDINAVLTLPASNDRLKKITGHAAKWHTDHRDSFALMVLLNNISEKDSHMEFIITKQYPSGQRYNKDISISNMDVKACIGDAGTFFLFRNGHYLHRAKILNGRERKTLHAIYLPDNGS